MSYHVSAYLSKLCIRQWQSGLCGRTQYNTEDRPASLEAYACQTDVANPEPLLSDFPLLSLKRNRWYDETFFHTTVYTGLDVV